jgi:nucleotide-binding universal stress UspA family protein
MNILIAIDTNLFSKAIEDFIISYIKANNVHFKIMHVIEPIFVGNLASGYSSEVLTNITESDKRVGKELTQSLIANLKKYYPDASYEQLILQGFPKEEILDVANDWPADLIIMGSHGRRGIDRFLMGSVSSAVLAHAPCNTIIIRVPQVKAAVKEVTLVKGQTRN